MNNSFIMSYEILKGHTLKGKKFRMNCIRNYYEIPIFKVSHLLELFIYLFIV